MQNRRKFLLALVSSVAAIGFVVSVVFADELLGVITKVDVEGKKLTIEEKGTDKEVEIKTTDATEFPSKGENKFDLEKLSASVKKAQEKGKKGVNVKVTHDNNVASKIEFQKKKGAGKKKDN
jgi:hypothetical protein